MTFRHGVPLVSNREFAVAVGCSVSMASLLRNGKRLPSGRMLYNICQCYKLDSPSFVYSLPRAQGLVAFQDWINDHIFGGPHAA